VADAAGGFHWPLGRRHTGIDTIDRTAEPIAPRAWMAMLSDEARITERLRAVNRDELDDQVTIEDPIAFARLRFDDPRVAVCDCRTYRDVGRPVACARNCQSASRQVANVELDGRTPKAESRPALFRSSVSAPARIGRSRHLPPIRYFSSLPGRRRSPDASASRSPRAWPSEATTRIENRSARPS
jgi:hypothetical protein